MHKFQDVKNFVSSTYTGVKLNDTSYQSYLIGIADRLKILGITDEEVLSAALLCQVINDSKSSFDEIDKRFGSRISVMVLALSKDFKIPNTIREIKYLKQLKEAPIEVKLIKLCEISANIKQLKNSSLSQAKKIKQLKKNIHYFNVLKPDLITNKTRYAAISSIVSGINEVLIQNKQRTISF